MDIHHYKNELFDDLEAFQFIPGKAYNRPVYLSMLDTYIPRDSLVVLAGRPRTGRTTFLLDFIAQNSLCSVAARKGFPERTFPRRGLAYFSGQKQELVLRKWIDIVCRTEMTNKETGDSLMFCKDRYLERIAGALIDFTFISAWKDLFLALEKDLPRLDPDYIVIDGFDNEPTFDEYTHGEPLKADENEINLIHFKKSSDRLFLLSKTLGHDAFYRSGNCRPVLEDLHSPALERNAEVIISLHRPDHYGIEANEYGDSLSDQVEVASFINRYGKDHKNLWWDMSTGTPHLSTLRK